MSELFIQRKQQLEMILEIPVAANNFCDLEDAALSRDLCPDCFSPIRHEGGCVVCVCGWSMC